MGGFKYKSIFYGVRCRVRYRGDLQVKRGTKNCVLPWKPMLSLIDFCLCLIYGKIFVQNSDPSFAKTRTHTQCHLVSLLLSTLVFHSKYDAIQINLKCSYKNNQLNCTITHVMMTPCKLNKHSALFLSSSPPLHHTLSTKR